MSGSVEMSTVADEPSDSDEAARQAAWAEYFRANPEILASYAYTHGYWPPGATLTGNGEWDASPLR